MTRKKTASKKTTPKKTTPKKTNLPMIVEFVRHLTGPPRRSPGQRCWMTHDQINQQKLTEKTDFVFVTTINPNADYITPNPAPQGKNHDH